MDSKHRVFLSYSQKDGDLVSRVAAQLRASDFLVDYDQTEFDPISTGSGIDYEGPWWESLKRMIAGANVFCLVVSKNSAASKVVGDEIDYAKSLGKRTIAIAIEKIDFRTAPPKLSELQVNQWFVDLPFDRAIRKLINVLNQDSEWLRKSRDLILAAQDWTASGRHADKLLHGVEISDAEIWSAQRPNTAPPIAEFVLGYIKASRSFQIRRQRIARTAVLVAAMLVGVLGIFVLIGQSQIGTQRSAIFAQLAQLASNASEYDRALRLSALANRGSILSRVSPEAVTVADSLLLNSPLIAEVVTSTTGSTVAAVSPDGKIIAIGDDIGSISLIDNAGGEIQLQSNVLRGADRSNPHRINDLRFSADSSKLLSVTNDGQIRVWDTKRKGLLRQIQAQGPRNRIDLSPDGKTLLLCQSGGGIKRWDIDSAHPVLPDISSPSVIYDCAFGSGAKSIITGTNDAVQIWNAGTGQQKASIPINGNVTTVAQRPQHSEIVVGTTNRQLIVIDEVLFRATRTIPAHGDTIWGIAFDESGTTAVTASEDSEAKIWDANGWRPLQTLRGHSGELVNVQSSADGNLFVTGSRDGTARVWKKPASRFKDFVRAEVSGHSPGGVYSLGMLPEMSSVYTIEQFGEARVRIWSLQNLAAAPVTLAKGFPGVRHAETTKKGDTLFLAGMYFGPTLLNLENGQTESLPFDVRATSAADLSETDQRYVLISPDGILQVWDIASGRRLLQMEHPNPDLAILTATFVGDDELLIGGAGGFAKRVSVLTGEEVTSFPIGDAALTGFAVHPSEKIIATRTDDSILHIWDATRPQPSLLNQFEHTGELLVARFSADGSRLITGTALGVITVWDTDSGKRIQSFPSVGAAILSIAFSEPQELMLVGADLPEAYILQVSPILTQRGSLSSTLSKICDMGLKTLLIPGESKDDDNKVDRVETIRVVNDLDISFAPLADAELGLDVCRSANRFENLLPLTGNW